MGFHSSKNYVNGLSPKELGNALYHIAQNTRTSKTYTQEFISNVLLRASELVYLIETRPTPITIETYPEDVRRGLDEAIIHDWTPPDNKTTPDGPPKTEYEKFMVRQWIRNTRSRPKGGIPRVGIEDDAPVPDFTRNWTRNKRGKTE